MTVNDSLMISHVQQYTQYINSFDASRTLRSQGTQAQREKRAPFRHRVWLDAQVCCRIFAFQL